MFDRFTETQPEATPSRFVETGSNSDFGDISSYAICAGCRGFHGPLDASADDGSNYAIINADDRGGGVSFSGKMSFDPIEAGRQITRTGLTWASGLGQATNVTYSFRATNPGEVNGTSGFTQFTATQITATIQALTSWSDVANITFTRVDDGGGYSDNAILRFSNYATGAAGAAAFAHLPGDRSIGDLDGDVFVNYSQSNNQNPALLNYGLQTLTHEIGHAIGLSHPAPYNASEGVSITYTANATYFEDSRQYTVMSYFSETNTGGSFSGNFSAVPLIDDIAAVQRLYGANMTTRTGDTVYGFNSTAGRDWYAPSGAQNRMIFAVWDAGGIDTLDFSGYMNNQVIDLRQGAFSNVGGLTGNVGIAIGAVIENAIGGSFSDQIRGNSVDNVITGNGGADNIDGGLGVDTVVFNGALSAYTITWNGQVGTVRGPEGTATITNVEWLRFSDQTIAAAPTGGLVVAGDITNETINGSALGDTIGGLGGTDVINGLAGNDFLDGGSGDDTLNGGDGDDVLVGGLGDDILNGGAGIDIADYSGASAAVEIDMATGLMVGNVGSDTFISIEGLNGSTFNDTLIGDANANIIRGGGGVDYISGGGGNDQLFAGAPGNTGGGADIIKPRSQLNNTIGTAQDLNDGFDLLARDGVENATTIPHATVLGVASGQYEYYSFTVVAGDTVRFDLDNVGFDGALRLFNAAGTELAQNDDAAAADRDGGSNTDSLLTYTFATAGTYYIQVSQWDGAGTGEVFTSSPAPVGARYQLNVSIPSATVQPDVFAGSTLNGDAGNDYLAGGIGPDTLNGGADNDVLFGGAGNDAINGGDGYDVAVYEGGRRAYSTTTYSSVSGGREGGTDTITGVESLAFIDGQLNFHRDGMAAQVMRLYDTAFNRIPDDSGFEAQLDAMEGGMSLEALAQLFADSVEFQNTYGSLDRREFVEQLYRNSLDREGDAAGIDNAVNSGLTLAQLVVAFSESEEHKNLTNATVLNGLWIADEGTLTIARLFDSTYNRLPDEGGLVTWRNALGAGQSLVSIADSFAASTEFTNTYGALNTRQFVEQLYRNVLNREGDEAGIQNAVNAIENGGQSRGQVMLAFSESAEHIALTRESWIGGVRFYTAPAAIEEGGKEADAQTLPSYDDALVLPAADDFLVHKGHDDALVLPGIDDLDLVAAKNDDVLVLPGIDTGAPHVNDLGHAWMFDHQTQDDAFVNLRQDWAH